MTTDLNLMPQEGKKAELVGNDFLARLFQAFSGGRIVLLLMLLGVSAGVWLGLSPQNMTMLQVRQAKPQVESPKIESPCLDKALVEGVRAALPIAQNTSSGVKVIDTLPLTASPYGPYANRMDNDSQSLSQANSRSAYLVAVANADGTRLKTIVNR